MKIIEAEDVVISGISCKLPESANFEEFAENLLTGKNMVTSDNRVSVQDVFDNLPVSSGKINKTKEFDLTFFGISNIVGTCMDPLTQKLLEQTFEAVLDAGLNPNDLRGTNTPVYTGATLSDFDFEWENNVKGGYGIMGRNRCMNANRISYWLDLKGTSASMDTTWTNGLCNIQNGFNAIKSGRCDTAIVSTANLHSKEETTLHLNDLGFLSPDGVCKSFDESANGYTRSDGVVVLILQRASIAKRCYATINHVFANCIGDRMSVLHKPVQENWEQLFEEFYSQCDVDPSEISFVEANGSGIKDEDTAELNAITKFFCRKRKSPLLIGSVKSNMGHAESSSSTSSVIKALVACETGMIPKNLHFNTPNSEVRGFQSGELKVVVKNTPLPDAGLIAINSFGFGGVFAHLVLKPNRKVKKPVSDGLPRLVFLSSRTNEMMDNLISKIESMPFDVEYLHLLNKINSKKMDKYLGRGYTILPKKDGSSGIHDNMPYNEMKRPVWFIFSGMGSQWSKMGRRLMDLPKFRESIEKSHKILEGKGLNLIKIITDDDPKMFENILNSFVGIAAIQIALIDLLRALKIVPDGMIGHSVGELGCAYADGCFTAEQMILSAYSRGKASLESSLIKGYMAAVGRGYNQIKDELPEGIEVACHNAADSCTISGPAEMVKDYVKQLDSRGIFAKTVNVSNIAYHSRYIKPAAPRLLKYLKEVIPNPKPRSSKWISTSNPEENWGTDLAKNCSAEYHTNNLLSSVLFEEGCRHIPKNAICIEVAPHGLLQAILKRSLGEGCTNISLTHRTAEDPLIFLFQSIGKLYLHGLEPQITEIYPKVEYPVSRNTPSIHQLVRWEHEKADKVNITRAVRKRPYSLKKYMSKTIGDDDSTYVINGVSTYPAAVFLHIVWKTFSSFMKLEMSDCPVLFENVTFEAPMPIHSFDPDEVLISLQRGTGDFEVMNDRLIVKGNVVSMNERGLTLEDEDLEFDTTCTISQDDLYKELQSNGYEVGDGLKVLDSISIENEGCSARVIPSANLIQAMEAMFQLQIMEKSQESGSLLYPKSFNKFYIVPKQFEQNKTLDDSEKFVMNYNTVQNMAKCTGLKMTGFKYTELPPPKSNLKFSTRKFVCCTDPDFEDQWKFLDFCFGVACDNSMSGMIDHQVSLLEITKSKDGDPFGKYLAKSVTHTKLKIDRVFNVTELELKYYDLILTSDHDLEQYIPFVGEFGFILSKVPKNKMNELPPGIDVISRFSLSDHEEIVLVKKAVHMVNAELIPIPKKESSLASIVRNLRDANHPVFLIGYEEPEMGIESFKKEIQAETRIPLRWIFVLDEKPPSFDKDSLLKVNQIKSGLVTSIFKNGNWGFFLQRSYRDSQKSDSKMLNIKKLNKELKNCYLSFDSTNDLETNQVEYAGNESANNARVMGIASISCDRSLDRDSHLKWQVPETWTLEEASTVPMSYSLAHYMINFAGVLKPYESVLVTDACSPLGMACVSIAFTVVSKIYVTVGSDEESAILRKRFPQLKPENIISHATKNFNVQLGILTKKKNPEFIINLLEGDKMLSAVSCLVSYGRIFHIGNEDSKKNVQLGTSIFLVSASFYSVSSESLTTLREDEKKLMHDLIENGIKDGTVKPLPKRVFAIDQFDRLHSEGLKNAGREKTILKCEERNRDDAPLNVDSECSYLIFGDETEVWVHVMRYLIRKGARRLVVCNGGPPKRAQRYGKIIKKYNVVIRHGKDVRDVQSLFGEAHRMGPLGGVIFTALKGESLERTAEDIDRCYRERDGFFVAITNKEGHLNEMCKRRNAFGFRSSNFIWRVDPNLIGRHFDLMNKLCGKDNLFLVSSVPEEMIDYESMDRMLRDLLPATVEDFCTFGESLSKDVRISYLPSMTGHKIENAKEVSPLVFVAGFNDPVSQLTPLARNLMYPCFCVHLPHKDLSIKKMASFIVPKIMSIRENANTFNIVGVSWGSYVALEVARQIEEVGGNVSLMLVDPPNQNLRRSLIASRIWESETLNILQGLTKKSKCVDLTSLKTWSMKANRMIAGSDLKPEEESSFGEAAKFIHNGLTRLVEYELTGIKLRGPLLVVKSGRHSTEDLILSKVCNSTWIKNIPLTGREFLLSNELQDLIHGCAITDSMSKSWINEPSWRIMEAFLDYEKLYRDSLPDHDIKVPTSKLKFSFGK